VEEINPPTRAELTNRPLLELLQQQNEHLQQQNEHLQKLMEVKERKVEEDSSNKFKRFASHNSLVYDGTPDPKAFED